MKTHKKFEPIVHAREVIVVSSCLAKKSTKISLFAFKPG